MGVPLSDGVTLFPKLVTPMSSLLNQGPRPEVRLTYIFSKVDFKFDLHADLMKIKIVIHITKNHV